MDTVIEPVIAGGVDYAPVTAADYLGERTLEVPVTAEDFAPGCWDHPRPRTGS